MALTLLERHQLRSSKAFEGRTAIALLDAANSIRWEADTTDNHTERLALADAIQADGRAATRMVARFLPFLLVHQDVVASGTAITDTDLGNAVVSYLDQVAVRDFTAEAV